MSDRKLKIYLAGPDVFLQNPMEISDAKKVLCEQYGFEGLFPLDNQVPQEILGKGGREMAFWIAEANEQMMEQADIIIAHITPFRGPSADSGTLVELGTFNGLKKIVYAYSNDITPFHERTLGYYKLLENAGVLNAGNLEMGATPTKLPIDTASIETLKSPFGVERFGLADNLMIENVVARRGGEFIQSEVRPGQELRSLKNFEECLRRLKQRIESGELQIK